ncbi:DUF1381 domain-containing protein [Staphylococcus nepalensis]|uniref:DUF1381 domain-containing protein n=1 Tax=Staphylococcus nepalensis TaxID=214473 RepID=UPI002B25D01B|nr:DUF1381 domain-containing protein [Staphylococcus nepalensis]WQL19488.1 DUF1381 domain-containing protein [Staphylococcus nepalensis]WQL21246.1 DUF1381 domain-containing protein [Staphylococcus nepalensis]
MTQFLVRKTHHTTGEVFFDVTRAKENEEFVVVDAESAEEALIKYRVGEAFRNFKHFLENNKLLQAIRKDSE